MTYLIHNNNVLAETSDKLKRGETVRVAYLTSGNSLVNAVYCTASTAKKWDRKEYDFVEYDYANLHNDKGIYKEYIAHKING